MESPAAHCLLLFVLFVIVIGKNRMFIRHDVILNNQPGQKITKCLSVCFGMKSTELAVHLPN